MQKKTIAEIAKQLDLDETATRGLVKALEQKGVLVAAGVRATEKGRGPVEYKLADGHDARFIGFKGTLDVLIEELEQ